MTLDYQPEDVPHLSQRMHELRMTATALDGLVQNATAYDHLRAEMRNFAHELRDRATRIQLVLTALMDQHKTATSSGADEEPTPRRRRRKA